MRVDDDVSNIWWQSEPQLIAPQAEISRSGDQPWQQNRLFGIRR